MQFMHSRAKSVHHEISEKKQSNNRGLYKSDNCLVIIKPKITKQQKVLLFDEMAQSVLKANNRDI